MSQIVLCSGTVTLQAITAGGRPVTWGDASSVSVPRCSGTWSFVNYVEPSTPLPISGSSSSTANIAYCLGTITNAVDNTAGADLSGVISCSTGWVQAPYTTPFDPSQIDATTASAMFAGGFLLYLTPWACAWGFSQMFKLLR